MDFQEKLAKYADVAVKIGLNLQPDQHLWISGDAHALPLVREIARCAYRMGCPNVYTSITDQDLSLIRFEEAPDEAFDHVNQFVIDGYYEHVKAGHATISITGTDPTKMAGIDPSKMARSQKAGGAAFKKVRDLNNRGNWLVIGSATAGWAKMVYPDLSEEEGIAALWEDIFKMCRVDQDDPVAAWEAHTVELSKRKDYLNEKKFASLRYTAPGTEFEVGLADGHKWLGAGDKTEEGLFFIPNIPTEEVFTTPHKDRINGKVSASMPLNFGGTLIEDFSLVFEDGKVVDVAAKSGEEVLKNMVSTDDGAGSLGEVALVPNSSPISQTGRIFFNTLFDENASNHIALGRAYREAVHGGNKMSPEEFADIGGNDSMIHVDFMIGSGDMDIDGVLPDGSVEPIMRGGEWAFDV